jgi:2-dehydro-3-deoxyglucarate aldolase/4-hydroxy-2-oxoheptanedioate aldolase
MRINTVKKALAEGRLQLGCGWSNLRSPAIARILAAAGFHWTYVDAEHGGFGIESLQDICRDAVSAGISPLVRVADLQYSLIARALDIGADGIVLPRVESPELLERTVSWTKYPPVGIRGYGLTPLHLNHEAVTIAQAIEHLNANTMVVLQIETRRAVEAREELLSVPGVDAVMMGPVDLSISLGVPGDFQHPKMVEAMESVRDACLRHGVAPGTQTRTPELARFWKERGMKFLGCGTEAAMLLERARELVRQLA